MYVSLYNIWVDPHKREKSMQGRFAGEGTNSCKLPDWGAGNRTQVL